MTHALNESGFTDRLVAKFMSIKLVSKSPWIFTISLGVLGMLLGCFMDQVPATAFMLAFVSRIYKELGYTSRDAYPHVANILTVFGVNIGGAMTPISHSLAILGIGIYEGATGESLSLFSYLAFGVPTGLILFVLLCVAVRLLTRPDMSKFKDFKIENVVKKQGPMTLREGTTAVVFFVTVIMWILPGVLKMFSDTAWVNAFNSFGITFWAILSVVVMAVIHIDGRPLLDVRTVVNQSINWGILIFISIGVYLGSAMSADSTGIVAAIQQNITPLTQSVAPVVVVFVIATVSVLMTNFASNVSTITVMTSGGCGSGSQQRRSHQRGGYCPGDNDVRLMRLFAALLLRHHCHAPRTRVQQPQPDISVRHYHDCNYISDHWIRRISHRLRADWELSLCHLCSEDISWNVVPGLKATLQQGRRCFKEPAAPFYPVTKREYPQLGKRSIYCTNQVLSYQRRTYRGHSINWSTTHFGG